MPISPFGWHDGSGGGTPLNAANLEAAHSAAGAYTDAAGGGGAVPLQVAKTGFATNLALSGFQTIFGYTLVTNDVIFLYGQTAPAQNGPWVAAAGAWTRPSWYANGATIKACQVAVTALPGGVWSLTTIPTTVDTTSTTWIQTVIPPSGAFNVRSYGAKGDYFSDDTAAINVALNAARAGAGGDGVGLLYFPNGDYRITSPINTINISLVGDGRGTTVIVVPNDFAAPYVIGSGTLPSGSSITLPTPTGFSTTTGGAAAIANGTTVAYRLAFVPAGFNGGATGWGPEATFTVPGAGGPFNVSFSWALPPNAGTTIVYGRTSAGELVIGRVGNYGTTFTDSGATTPLGRQLPKDCSASNMAFAIDMQPSASMATPTAPTVTGNTGAGSAFTAGQVVSTRIVATVPWGKTLASTATSVTIAGNGNNAVSSWAAVVGATSYFIYRGAPGAELFIDYVAGGTTTYTDTGAITPSGAVPATNTTGGIGLLPADTTLIGGAPKKSTDIRDIWINALASGTSTNASPGYLCSAVRHGNGVATYRIRVDGPFFCGEYCFSDHEETHGQGEIGGNYYGWYYGLPNASGGDQIVDDVLLTGSVWSGVGVAKGHNPGGKYIKGVHSGYGPLGWYKEECVSNSDVVVADWTFISYSWESCSNGSVFVQGDPGVRGGQIAQCTFLNAFSNSLNTSGQLTVGTADYRGRPLDRAGATSYVMDLNGGTWIDNVVTGADPLAVATGVPYAGHLNGSIQGGEYLHAHVSLDMSGANAVRWISGSGSDNGFLRHRGYAGNIIPTQGSGIIAGDCLVYVGQPGTGSQNQATVQRSSATINGGGSGKAAGFAMIAQNGSASIPVARTGQAFSARTALTVSGGQYVSPDPLNVGCCMPSGVVQKLTILGPNGLQIPTSLNTAAAGVDGTWGAPQGFLQYVVTAVNALGETFASNLSSIALTATQHAALTWSAMPGAVTYKVYRAASGAGQWGGTNLVASGVATNSFNDTGIALAAGSPPSGTYTLSFMGQTTGAITASSPSQTSVASIQSGLQGLSTIGSGNLGIVGQMTLNGSPPTYELFLIFCGVLAGQAVPPITVGTNSLPSGNTPVLAPYDLTCGLAINASSGGAVQVNPLRV